MNGLSDLYKFDLLNRAGGALTADEARLRLGLPSTQALHHAVDSRRLFCVEVDGSALFPTFQFDGSGIVASIPLLLGATPTARPWALLQFLVEGDEGIGSDRPIDLLKRGTDEIGRVVRFARTLED